MKTYRFITALHLALTFAILYIIRTRSFGIWGGNHWVFFGTKFERVLFGNTDLITLILFMPVIFAIAITALKREWRFLAISIICAALSWWCWTGALIMAYD